jgi:NadR type nicotinamide-nucleotide adenylyltransferase
VTHGFVIGKFMPPHAGHVSLCVAAARMVDRLTILVCWLPDDPIPGETRLAWMRELFPHARVIGHSEIVPQMPTESPHFWPIWRRIVKAAHPEPIDFVFAGEEYGAVLAEHVGGQFVPLGGRIIAADQSGPGGISGSAIRADIAGNWRWLPAEVRRDLVKVVSLHGIESTGKSTLAAALADQLGTIWVPEYGRSHCEVHGTDLHERDLETIAAAQVGMIAAARSWSGPVLLSDTDWLMTRAWHEMMLAKPMAGPAYPLADLYLLLEPDQPWVDDGLRIYGADEERIRFHRLCVAELEGVGANYVTIRGSWAQRRDQALAAIVSLQTSIGIQARRL